MSLFDLNLLKYLKEFMIIDFLILVVSAIIELKEK